jgi:hypothetical protein
MQSRSGPLHTAFDTKKFSNYMLLLIIIATTANPYFFDSNEFLIVGFLISAAVFLMRGKKFDQNYVLVCGLFLLLEVLQFAGFGGFNVQTFSALFIKLTFAYFVVKCVEGNFFEYYVQILKVICWISLGFYTLSFVPGVYDFIYNSITPFFEPPFYKTVDFFTAQHNVIIYTFAYDCYQTYRNPGPFWEPGIYSIFIILALLFNLVREKKVFSSTNTLFIVSILTTVSTAGYLGLFLLLMFYLISNKASRYRWLYVTAILSAAVYLFYTLPFLSAKLEQNIQMSDYTGSRFGSLAADWALFTRSPLIGWGRGEMRYGGSSQLFFGQELHRNNGLASFLTQYGIFLPLACFYLYNTTFKYLCILNKYTTAFASAALLVMLFVSFSQVIYTRQFFLCLLFLGVHFRKLNSVQNS